MTKKRLDVLLVERGLAESRRRAQGLILGGAVTIDGIRVMKAGTMVADDAAVEVAQAQDEFVSRGARKLLSGLEHFEIDVDGKIALDVGASTGGFTEVLLRQGAARVYSIDVGYGQLAWRLRQNPRVVVMERTNIREVTGLPEPVQIVTVDVSFISLDLVLPVLVGLVAQEAEAVVLIKPQFEAGRGSVGKGGVVRDAAIHRQVLERVLRRAGESRWEPVAVIESPLLGPAGNREFLAHLRLADGPVTDVSDAVGMAEAAVADRE